MKTALVFSFLMFLILTSIKPVYAQLKNPSVINNTLEDSPLYTPLEQYIPNQKQHVEQLSAPGSIDLTKWGQSMTKVNTDSLGFEALSTEIGPNGQLRVMRNGGAVGFFANSIAMLMDNRPASSLDYVAYMGGQLRVPGTPEPAYAAGGGLGFNGLTPVLNIWTLTRNLSYFLFAIIFIVIGVMIMTRRKIDPKTVASIQNALPKIIFALIIVTFSYAIAGFAVDIMYIALALIVTLMNSLPGAETQGVNVSQLLSGSIFQFALDSNGLWGVASNAAVNVFNIVNGVLGSVQGVSQFVGGVAGGLAFLIVAIAILVALFRTWFALLGAFAHVILAVIFAPLRLTMDAIPGQNQFSGWLKDLLANLLAFPLVTILLAIGAYIASYPSPGNVPGFTPPLLGAGTVAEVLPFVGLGILLTIPKSLDILREVLKAPSFKYGGAWMENMKPAAGVTADISQYGARKGIQAVGASTYWAGVKGAKKTAGWSGAAREAVAGLTRP